MENQSSDEDLADGRAVPPYEGRRGSADVTSEDKADREADHVGGATGPVADSGQPAPAPQQGPTASPADEQPAAQMPQSQDDDPGSDLTAHVPGTRRGEELSDGE